MWIFDTQVFFKFSCFDSVPYVFFQKGIGLGTKLRFRFFGKTMV